MHKIYSMFRGWLSELLKASPTPDPLATFSARELADLPIHHPVADRLTPRS